MKHFGIVVTPAPGHLFPICSIARALMRRGHRVTILTIEDMLSICEQQRVPARAVGQDLFPKGSTMQRWSKKRGAAGAIRAGFEFHIRHMQALLAADLSDFDALIVDELQFQGATMAERRGIPFVGVGTALSFLPGTSSTTPECLQRRKGLAPCMAAAFFRWASRPWLKVINTARAGLSVVSQFAQCYSPRAHVFTFPRCLSANLFPSHFHFVGNVIDETRPMAAFPYERLDGRPLVYASFGTTMPLTKRLRLFAAVAEACSAMPVQLVIGMGVPSEGFVSPTFVGDPVVVPFAPQSELTGKANLVVSHAGMNTIAETLTQGTPLVVLPKPDVAVASGVTRSGAGIAVGRPKPRLVREAIARVLATPSYKERAVQVARGIAEEGGVERAAEIIIQAT